MAGKVVAREIFCWDLESGELKIFVASSKKGAVGVGLSLDKDLDSSEYFNRLFRDAIIIKDKEMNRQLIYAVKMALKGKDLNKKLPLDIKGTDFQIKAWNEISKIPFGETRTYGEVAMMVGKPKGARAIGQAMNRNPLPMIFPCHRVVAANGLGGFGGGLELKRYLLEREIRN